MNKEVAKLDYSLVRVFRKILLELQKSCLIPAAVRYRMLRMAGVKIEGTCFVGNDVTFDTLRPDLITLGEGCCITTGTKIISHFLSPNDDVMYFGKIKIGSGVFIGMNTLIVNSVIVGDRAVIGAGSVVTKDIPAYEIWAGNPAKFIRNRNDKS